MSRVHEALRCVSDQQGWYTKPVTLVYDLSESKTWTEGHWARNPRFLHAGHEPTLHAMSMTCRQLHDGAERLPVGGIWYHDHLQMIAALEGLEAPVESLVVVLPDDDTDHFYVECMGSSQIPAHLARLSRALQEVMSFASKTARRVAVFNAGARLEVDTSALEAYAKPLTSALLCPGMRFPFCTEMVVTRDFKLSGSYRDTLNNLLPADSDDDDLDEWEMDPREENRHVQPMWGISRTTFPQLQRVFTIANMVITDYYGVSRFHNLAVEAATGVRHRMREIAFPIRNAELEGDEEDDQYGRVLPPHERRALPDLGIMDNTVDADDWQRLPDGAETKILFGLDCTVSSYEDPRHQAYPDPNLPPSGVLKIAASDPLPRTYTEAHALVQRLQRNTPKMKPPCNDRISVAA